MPPELNEDVNSQSSGEIEINDVADGVQDMPPSDAGSSPAEDVAEDTLSIVQDVVATDSEANAAGSSPDGEEGQVDENGDPSDEDYSNLPFGKHPRFQQILGQVKEAEAKVEELTAKATEFETDATRYRNIEGFLHDNSLSADEAAGGLEVLALAKTDPVKAWDQIKPWVTQLATAAGAMVPPDLQKRVQEGQLTPEAARELASANARSDAAEKQRQMAAERAQRDQTVQTQQLIASTVDSWETDRRLRDPNYDAKSDALQREVAFLQSREGRPADAVGVKAQLDKAYEAVSAKFVPTPAPAKQKKAVKPVTGGQSAGKPQADAQSTISIIDEVMSRG
ncbi:hypothetical protein PhaeoP66_03212 [Phaeobacter inhibens]|uniref:Scaffolding protein n=1 Tax=Phaeobacter inhibens TaxID=221822 RepID=A0ABM6RHT2_9RHOB|nr:hypothetical protein [Phaeobacter inhibens]AUQ95954.1 hypothetical protein PhaeoP66_03212 [Phaeobacter inhibens]